MRFFFLFYFIFYMYIYIYIFYFFFFWWCSFLQENEQGIDGVELPQVLRMYWAVVVVECCTSEFQCVHFLQSCRYAGADAEGCKSLLCLFKSRKQGSLISELISLENECKLAAPQHTQRQKEFPCTCGNLAS